MVKKTLESYSPNILSIWPVSAVHFPTFLEYMDNIFSAVMANKNYNCMILMKIIKFLIQFKIFGGIAEYCNLCTLSLPPALPCSIGIGLRGAILPLTG